MKRILRLFSVFLIFALMLTFVSVSVKGSESSRIIRVGWFESPFNRTDEYGRRSGYSYEFQQRLSIYNGWEYEYVTGSWSELFELLQKGKIDLLSDVSYTEDRATKMLFSSQSMGFEDYYLYKSIYDDVIMYDDLSTFNGTKVGINRGSIMVGMFKEWKANHGVEAEIVELDASVEEAITMLNRGTIDLYLGLDGYFHLNEAIPLYKIGSSNYYFAVRKDALDIYNELNSAMNKLYIDDPFYIEELHSKYFRVSVTNLLLSSQEKEWLDTHQTIKVGYQDNYLAFCAQDENGNLTGALKDYLDMASNCFNDVHLNFQPIAYPTASAALEALKKGEVDCMFPANLSVYDGETNGFFMTSPIMKTDIVAIIMESEQKSFIKKQNVLVAVNAGNTNYDMFLADNFPDWHAVYFKDTSDGLKGISEGKADCLLMSNYRFNNVASKCKEYKLVSLSTGVEIEYCFAVVRENKTLYSILNKTINLVPQSAINYSLTHYYTEDSKITIKDMLSQNLSLILIVSALVGLVILALILRTIFSEKKSKSRQMLIKATEYDHRTGLYNKLFFIEYINILYNENPDKPMDAIAINIEHFRSVNALNGRNFGDQVIIELGDEIRLFVKENGGIASHSEADHFAIYCPHLEDYNVLYRRLQDRVDGLSSSVRIIVRIGVMPWQKDVSPNQLIDNASTACNLAKDNHLGHVYVYDETARKLENRNVRILNDVKKAIENHEFEVYYQPKYDVRFSQPKLDGAEALIRWHHPEFGMISPIEFVPLFEKNGYIGLVDQFVREEVVKQIIAWKEKYGITIPVSVNVSRIEILEKSFEASLDILLEKYNLSKEYLGLEVTESAFTDSANELLSIISSLRKSGYMIEMDDFGSGYSSLNMLSQMPIDILKMDRAFIMNIENNSKDVKLVELILGIAKNLKAQVVAEGVETEKQLQILKDLGCEIAQGFYLSKPIPAFEFEKIIINNK